MLCSVHLDEKTSLTEAESSLEARSAKIHQHYACD